jgi:hypothetical protein
MTVLKKQPAIASLPGCVKLDNMVLSWLEMVTSLTGRNSWPLRWRGRSNFQTRPAGSNMEIGRFAAASPRQDGHPRNSAKVRSRTISANFDGALCVSRRKTKRKRFPVPPPKIMMDISRRIGY